MTEPAVKELSCDAWKKITPEHLRTALEHIRKSFDTDGWRWQELTERLCYAALHPHSADLVALTPYTDALPAYKQALGPLAFRQFERILDLKTPPAFFKAYYDLYYSGMELTVHKQFAALLKISLANVDAVIQHPADWAKSHLQLLIKQEDPKVQRWIKDVCDKQETPDPELLDSRGFEDFVFWRAWRAPRLIYMQPAGVLPYHAETVWQREDENRTIHLLDGYSKRFTEFLDISLEEICGHAHVRIAQERQPRAVPVPSSYPKPSVERAAQVGNTNPESSSQPVGAQPAPSPSPLQANTDNGRTAQSSAPDYNWQDIEIVFLGDGKLQIFIRKQAREALNYGEFGLNNKKSGLPNKAWSALKQFAIRQGTIRSEIEAGVRWNKFEKRVQELRKLLRQHFKLETDPIVFVEKLGYRTQFKIRCAPSFYV